MSGTGPKPEHRDQNSTLLVLVAGREHVMGSG
jgi:hypothetical protein